MQHKILLLASFVNKEYLNEFLTDLEYHGVDKETVFIFNLSDKDFLLTYKIKVSIGVRFDIRKELRKTIQIHKKRKTFFTINALNRLIEVENGLSRGNINYKDYQVDWDKFSDKLVLLKNNELDISHLERVFLSDL